VLPKKKEKEERRKTHAGCLWLTPVILASQEAEIRKIMVQSQLGQIVHENLSKKKKPSQKRAGGVAQGTDSEFKPQYQKKQKTKKKKKKKESEKDTKDQSLKHF
jgi:hypothetical protein